MKKIFALALVLAVAIGIVPAFSSLQSEAAIGESSDIQINWKVGQLYDQPESQAVITQKSRYAVISGLELGDVIQFTLPSKWGMWCYPADENGVIDSASYFAGKNGGVYTVSTINGRVATHLRVSVYSQPKVADITDKMWSDHGIKLTKLKVDLSKNIIPRDKWNKGAFYDTATPNTNLSETRRYTVLDVEPGQIYEFLVPLKWTIWVYPADENGSINGTYIELVSGSQYIIKPVNGRMPTQLRITTCPKPDSVISEAMWSTFDAVCLLSDEKYELSNTAPGKNCLASAKWLPGAYYDNAVHTAKNSRYAVIPCELNDTFEFNFKDSNFGFSVYYYDKNGELKDFGHDTITKNGKITITEKNGKVPTELRITAYTTGGGEITDVLWNKLGATCIHSSDHIKVGTMNYGLWNDGGTKYVPDEKVDEVLAKWKDMLDDHELDIIGGQEYLEYFDRANKFTAEELVFSYKYPYQYTFPAMKHFASKMEITDLTVVPHKKDSSRSYVKGYTMINGKKVCVINAHCSIQTDATIARKSEFAELIEVMKKEEYVIMFGDFNAYSTYEFKDFTDAGYKVANAGAFGKFRTWTHFDTPSSWGNMCIDNIVVSPNIQIVSVECDRRDLSDHNLLVAELILRDGPVEDTPPASTDTSSDETSGTTTDTTDTTDGSDATTDVVPDGNTDSNVATGSDSNVATGSDSNVAPSVTDDADPAEDPSGVSMVVGIVVSVAILAAGAAAIFFILKKFKTK